MLKRRTGASSDFDLPMNMPSASSTVDGSGRGVHMDAPIVRTIKESSFFTKSTYVWLVGSVCMIWFGIRDIRYHSASVWLNCENNRCQLSLTSKGWSKTTKMEIERHHIDRTDVVKVDPEGSILETNPHPSYTAHHHRDKTKKKSGAAGPDKDGNYESYVVVFKEEEDVGGGDHTDIHWHHEKHALDGLADFVHPTPYGEYIFHMRRFNLGHSTRGARSQVSKINSYLHNRRTKLSIKEQTSIRVLGLLSIIFGSFSLLLCALVGQFWDEKGDRSQRRRGGSRPQQRGGNISRRREPSGAGNYGGYRPSSQNKY